MKMTIATATATGKITKSTTKQNMLRQRFDSGLQGPETIFPALSLVVVDRDRAPAPVVGRDVCGAHVRVFGAVQIGVLKPSGRCATLETLPKLGYLPRRWAPGGTPSSPRVRTVVTVGVAAVAPTTTITFL